jgi:hypothetical protein
VCVCVCVHVSTCMYTRKIHIHTTYKHKCVVCVFVCVCMCLSVCLSVCVHLYVHAYTLTCIHTHNAPSSSLPSVSLITPHLTSHTRQLLTFNTNRLKLTFIISHTNLVLLMCCYNIFSTTFTISNPTFRHPTPRVANVLLTCC